MPNRLPEFPQARITLEIVDAEGLEARFAAMLGRAVGPPCDVVWGLAGACWHAGPAGEHPSLELTLPALTVTAAYAAHGDRLFRFNPRSDLGDNRVNREIAATLRRQPELFHLLNNGITALCRGFRLLGQADAAGPRLEIADLQVVNGCQTTRSLWKAASRDAPSLERCFVNVRLIASPQLPDSGLHERISAATNRQTALLYTDDLSNRPEQQRLRLAFAALRPAWFYEAKRGEWNLLGPEQRARFERSDGVGRHRRIGPRRLAQAARAASGAPGEAKDRGAGVPHTALGGRRLRGDLLGPGPAIAAAAAPA